MGKGKLNLYTIGQSGVNVVANPLQLRKDQATQLQNVIFPTASGEGGLQKRGGLTRLNASALNSGASILALGSVPLPNPFNTATLVRKYLYLHGGPLTDWVRSADGTTWVGLDAPGVASILTTTAGLADIGLPTVQPVPGLMFRLGATANTFYAWDGTSDQFVLTVPSTGAPGTPLECYSSFGLHDGAFYFGCLDSGVNFGAVFKLDTITGQLTLINGAINGGGYSPLAMVSYLGKLFIAATDLVTGAAPNCFVFQCEPSSSTAWVTDSANLGGPVLSMVNFKGNLYLATGTQNAAVPMRIYKRTPSGVYSTVYTDATPWNVNSGGTMIVFNGALFAYIGGTIVTSTDGTVWSTALDVYTTYGSLQYRSGPPVIFNNELYWAFREVTGTETNSRVLKRTTGGVWSVVYGPARIGSAALTVLELP